MNTTHQITGSQAIEIIKGLNPEAVDKTYSGKPGCMCGCKGTYKEGLSKAIAANMVKIIENGATTEIEHRPGNYIFISTETRYYAIYFKEQN